MGSSLLACTTGCDSVKTNERERVGLFYMQHTLVHPPGANIHGKWLHRLHSGETLRLSLREERLPLNKAPMLTCAQSSRTTVANYALLVRSLVCRWKEGSRSLAKDADSNVDDKGHKAFKDSKRHTSIQTTGIQTVLPLNSNCPAYGIKLTYYDGTNTIY